MRNDIVGWLLALGVGGILVEIIRSFFQRKNLHADYADVIAKSAMMLLEPLEKRIKELEAELVKVKREAERWKAEAQAERIVFHQKRTYDPEAWEDDR